MKKKITKPTPREFNREDKVFLGATEYRWIALSTVSYDNEDLTETLKEDLKQHGFVKYREGGHTTIYCKEK